MQSTLYEQVAVLNHIHELILKLELEGKILDEKSTALLVLWVALCWKTE